MEVLKIDSEILAVYIEKDVENNRFRFVVSRQDENHFPIGRYEKTLNATPIVDVLSAGSTNVVCANTGKMFIFLRGFSKSTRLGYSEWCAIMCSYNGTRVNNLDRFTSAICQVIFEATGVVASIVSTERVRTHEEKRKPVPWKSEYEFFASKKKGHCLTEIDPKELKASIRKLRQQRYVVPDYRTQSDRGWQE